MDLPHTTSVSSSRASEDRTASYIVLYMSAVLCVVFAATAPMGWPMIIFALTAALHLCFARGLQTAEGDRFRYLERRFRLPILLLLGALQAVRLRLTSKLVTYRTQGVVAMDVLEGAALLLFVAYVLWRGRSAQLRLQPLAALQVVSLAALGFALLYLHWRRPVKHRHVSNDWRLLYTGMSNLIPAVLLVVGPGRLPAWTLEFAGILCTTLAYVSSGHAALRGF